MGHSDPDPAVHERRPWNAGQNVGPKRPLKPRNIWAIRFYLDEHKRLRDRALFDLAIDSKLRGCDPVKIRIGDVVSGRTITASQTAAKLACAVSLKWLNRRGKRTFSELTPVSTA